LVGFAIFYIFFCFTQTSNSGPDQRSAYKKKTRGFLLFKDLSPSLLPICSAQKGMNAAKQSKEWVLPYGNTKHHTKQRA